MPAKESEKPAHIPDAAFKQIAKVHNSMVGHWGLQKCRERLNDPMITDRTITQFIHQCPCCQVMSRLKILIRTHLFTCASYNPFESLHIDHIGPLPVDDKGNTQILVMIDAFSRWVELFPTKTTGASECIFQHFGRFGRPDVIHTDQGPPYHGCRRSNIPSSQRTRKRRAVSSSVLMKKSCAIFVPCFLMHACKSYEELPMVQRIMNTDEKTSTGVTPAEFILNNSIRLSNRILSPLDSVNRLSQVALSDTMDNWVAQQHSLLTVAQAHQLQSDCHLLVEYDPRITEYPVHSYVLFTPSVGRGNKLLPKHRGPFQVMDKSDSIYPFIHNHAYP